MLYGFIINIMIADIHVFVYISDFLYISFEINTNIMPIHDRTTDGVPTVIKIYTKIIITQI